MLLACLLLHGGLLYWGWHGMPSRRPAPAASAMTAWLLPPPPAASPAVSQDTAVAPTARARAAGSVVAPRAKGVRPRPSAAAPPPPPDAGGRVGPSTDPAAAGEAPTAADTAHSPQRALDLSDAALGRALRNGTGDGLARAAGAQLGIAKPPDPLARSIAASAIPDCLRESRDGEGQRHSAAAGGLLALPFIAYAAVAGKCR